MFGPGYYPRIVAAFGGGEIICIGCLTGETRAAVLDDREDCVDKFGLAPVTDYDLENWADGYGAYCGVCGGVLVEVTEEDEP